MNTGQATREGGGGELNKVDDDQKRSSFFSGKNGVARSVGAPGDINVSDGSVSD